MAHGRKTLDPRADRRTPGVKLLSLAGCGDVDLGASSKPAPTPSEDGDGEDADFGDDSPDEPEPARCPSEPSSDLPWREISQEGLKVGRDHENDPSLSQFLSPARAFDRPVVSERSLPQRTS